MLNEVLKCMYVISRVHCVVRRLCKKYIKGSKERYLLEQKHNLQMFGVVLFVKAVYIITLLTLPFLDCELRARVRCNCLTNILLHYIVRRLSFCLFSSFLYSVFFFFSCFFFFSSSSSSSFLFSAFYCCCCCYYSSSSSSSSSFSSCSFLSQPSATTTSFSSSLFFSSSFFLSSSSLSSSSSSFFSVSVLVSVFFCRGVRAKRLIPVSGLERNGKHVTLACRPPMQT